MSTQSSSSSQSDASIVSHQLVVQEQFRRQAEGFARSPELHNDAQVRLIVEAAAPDSTDESLDVACGPGTVVAAFAPRVCRAVGLDAVASMLNQARALAKERKLTNVEWRQGEAYYLPFAEGAFSIVTCRFAFHHFEEPTRAFAEMVRVCRSGGRIVLCDAVASADQAKAAAFNNMERHRDPSTIAFRPLSFLIDLFTGASLPSPSVTRFLITYECEKLITKSFPVDDDRDRLRQMIAELIASDALDVGTAPGETNFLYPAVALTAIKP